MARFRTMSISRASVLAGHVLGNIIQAVIAVVARARRRPADRLPPDAPDRSSGCCCRRARAHHVRAHLDRRSPWACRPSRSRPRATCRCCSRAAVPRQRLRADRVDARVAAVVRRVPAVHAVHRDRARAAARHRDRLEPVLAVGWCIVIAVAGYVWSMSIYERKSVRRSPPRPRLRAAYTAKLADTMRSSPAPHDWYATPRPTSPRSATSPSWRTRAAGPAAPAPVDLDRLGVNDSMRWEQPQVRGGPAAGAPPNASEAAARIRDPGVQDAHVEHAAVELPALQRRDVPGSLRPTPTKQRPDPGAPAVHHDRHRLRPAQHAHGRDHRREPACPAVLDPLAHRHEVGIDAHGRGVEHGDGRPIADVELRDIRSHALAALQRVDGEVDGCRARRPGEVVERAAGHDEQRQVGSRSPRARRRRPSRRRRSPRGCAAARRGPSAFRATAFAGLLALLEHVHRGTRQPVGDAPAAGSGPHHPGARRTVHHDEPPHRRATRAARPGAAARGRRRLARTRPARQRPERRRPPPRARGHRPRPTASARPRASASRRRRRDGCDPRRRRGDSRRRPAAKAAALAECPDGNDGVPGRFGRCRPIGTSASNGRSPPNTLLRR